MPTFTSAGYGYSTTVGSCWLAPLVGANSNPLAAGFVQEMVKTIRGLGGIAVTSTQGMQDLFGLDSGKYGKGILDSSRIKLVMQMEEQEARLIQGVLNLSKDEVRQITRFRRGGGAIVRRLQPRPCPVPRHRKRVRCHYHLAHQSAGPEKGRDMNAMKDDMNRFQELVVDAARSSRRWPPGSLNTPPWRCGSCARSTALVWAAGSISS